MSFVEMAIGWFAPSRRLRALCRIEGIENLEAALSKGGVLLFAAHFTPLEVGVAVLESYRDRCAGMYRPQRNATMDLLIKRGRSRYLSKQVARDNVRGLVKLLKRGFIVIYLPDQTYIGNQSELMSFFGEPAVTNTAMSKIAAISGATILPYYFRRLSGKDGYEVTIGAPLDGIPSSDPVDDTRRLFATLEAQIRAVPEQYVWTYKKFKRRPPGLPDLYADT